MRVLIQTLGSAGDVHPFIGVAGALSHRGHDVHLLANEAFGSAIESAGLNFVQLGDEAAFRELASRPELWHPRRGLKVIFQEAVAEYLQESFDALATRVVPQGTVILCSTLGFAGHCAAEALDVPLAIAHLAPSVFRSVHRALYYPGLPIPDWLPHGLKRAIYRIVDWHIDGMVGGRLNEFRAGHGLEPVRRVFDRWIHDGQACLGLFPSWFAPPQPDWPENLQLTGFPLFDEGEQVALDEELRLWLEAGDPPIAFTAGSAHLFGAAYYRTSVEAALELGRRAVLVTQNEAVLPDDLPEEVRHVAYAPFSHLFSRCAAVVHHGGIGTSARSLAAGVPSLAVAMGFDQFDNGAHLINLSAGGLLPMNGYNKRSATRALSKLLGDPAVAAGAKRASELIAQEDPRSRACEAIEAVLA